MIKRGRGQNPGLIHFGKGVIMKYKVNTVEVPYYGGLVEVFIDKIEKFLRKYIKTDERIKKWVEKKGGWEKVQFLMRVETLSEQFEDEIKRYRGRMTKKWLYDRLREYKHREYGSTFSTTTWEKVIDGKVDIRGQVVYIKRNSIARDICTDIYELDTLWKRYEWLLKHEMGHFIDHIINHDGIPIEEYEAWDDAVGEAYEKHYKWLEEYEKLPGFKSDTVNRKYYEMPQEARANEYAGIDVEEMIKLDNQSAKKFKGKIITTNIQINNIKDMPKPKPKKEPDSNGDKEEKKGDSGEA